MIDKYFFSRITFLDLFRKFLRSAPNWLLVITAEFIANSKKEGIYPGWRFAVEEYKPTQAVLRRLAIWQEFANRDLQDTPVRVVWYEGLILNLRLGNDQSRCLYVSGSFEPNELWFLGQILEPGMCFVDAGANEGFYSIYAAKKVGPSGKVFAFEPSPRERRCLQRNVAFNHITNIKIISQALADVVGKGVLNLADYEHNGQNTLGKFGYSGVTCIDSLIVELTTLDTLREAGRMPKVHVLKMDIEGAELKALKGAINVLRNDRPLILMELFDSALLGQDSSASEVLEFLSEIGYDFSIINTETGQLIPFEYNYHMDSVNIIARSVIY